jgi:tRNA-splicing ligase RtcB
VLPRLLNPRNPGTVLLMNKIDVRVDACRVDAVRVRIGTPSGLDIQLFAKQSVPVDRASLAEVGTLSGIADTLLELNRVRFFGDFHGDIGRCVLTPDFHKGAGIPVGTVIDAHGFVIPRCAGTDIGCGMRLVVTDMTREEFERAGARLDRNLRHAFFEGGRDIPMDPASRAAVLRDGAPGLKAPASGGGLWRQLDPQLLELDLARTHRRGSWPTRDLWEFGDYVEGSGGTSHDAVIASIGGGNHFVELQSVDACIDRHACWNWGLKLGMVAVMVHSGSVGLGGMVGQRFMDIARNLHPRGMAMPRHGFHPIPTVGPLAGKGDAYLSAMGLAANFAVVNRLMLTALTLRCLSDVAGRVVAARLVYDAPHNLVWSDGQNHLHRKGACPAANDPADPLFPDGHPVIVPGSMGDSSYVLKGHGCVASLCSAPHGAGRLAARGEGRRRDTGELGRIRVVTKIDPTRVRREVAAEHFQTLMEEAPSQYKSVTPVVETVADAGIASPVARLRPLLTVKG